MRVTLQGEARITVQAPGNANLAFDKVCEANPDLRIEQDGTGKIHITPPSGNESSYRNVEILVRLYRWKGRKKRGKVFDSDTIFSLSDGSRTDRIAALLAKMETWIANGVQVAWLIDADKRIVWIYAQTHPAKKLIAPAIVVGQGPVAGFRLVMAEIYTGLSSL